MYAILGITGKVGGATARTLLANGQRVRAILRDDRKAAEWAAQGAEVAIADWHDRATLIAAFSGVEGVFVMLPPNFAPLPDFPEARAQLSVLHDALAAAAPPRFVALSSVGAHRPRGLGLITQSHLLEQALGSLPIASALLRAAWFMENTQWDIAPAREHGEIPSFLTPLDRAIPMIATDDIGAVAARTLQQRWSGRRVLELSGPQACSPNDLAAALAQGLDRSVTATVVPRETWQDLFVQQGMPTQQTGARIEMLDGFNSGWITFEHAAHTETVTTTTTLQTALAPLLAT
ncbi:MAG: NmrA family protein [Nevskia sp.]|nr:NmrA family protein [Nevskia sp.]